MMLQKRAYLDLVADGEPSYLISRSSYASGRRAGSQSKSNGLASRWEDCSAMSGAPFTFTPMWPREWF